jgi:hypothetical protein
MTRGTCLRITRTMRTLQHVAYNRDMRTEKSDVPIDVRMYAFHRPMRGQTLGKTHRMRTIRTCTDLPFVQAIDSIAGKHLLIYCANVSE